MPVRRVEYCYLGKDVVFDYLSVMAGYDMRGIILDGMRSQVTARNVKAQECSKLLTNAFPQDLAQIVENYLWTERFLPLSVVDVFWHGCFTARHGIAYVTISVEYSDCRNGCCYSAWSLSISVMNDVTSSGSEGCKYPMSDMWNMILDDGYSGIHEYSDIHNYIASSLHDDIYSDLVPIPSYQTRITHADEMLRDIRGQIIVKANAT